MDLRIRLSAKVDQEGRLVWNEPARFRAWAALAKGKSVEVNLERQHSRRSSQANRWYWSALVPFAAEVFEQKTGQPFTKDAAHYALKLAFLGHTNVQVKTSVAYGGSGVIVAVPASTAKLSVEEFQAYCQRIEAWIEQEFKVKPELIDAEAFS